MTAGHAQSAVVGRAVKTANATARAALIAKYRDEYDALVRQHMTELGYTAKVITRTSWTKNGVSE